MVFQRRLSCTDTDSIDLSCRCSQFTWTQDPSTFFLEHVHPRCYCDDPQSSLKRLSRLSLDNSSKPKMTMTGTKLLPGPSLSTLETPWSQKLTPSQIPLTLAPQLATGQQSCLSLTSSFWLSILLHHPWERTHHFVDDQ